MRRGLPLALTIAVHLLLAACLYLARRDPATDAPAGPQSFMVMLNQPTVPAPARQPQAPILRRPAPAPAKPAAAPVALAAPAAPVAPIEAVEAAAAPPPPHAGGLVARAIRDAGKIDRALRAGAPPLAGPGGDAPRARFERAVAAAWIDRSKTLVMDRYVAPDGVAITRLSNGAGARCYMSGTVNFVPGILHDSARPQEVNCPPAGSGWTRM